MCTCPPGIHCGSEQAYQQMVLLTSPFSGKEICIDPCLVAEITWLWQQRIHTTGCCCGHGTRTPYINVLPEHQARMRQLGYRYRINRFGVRCYYPLTVSNHFIIKPSKKCQK